MKASLDVVGLGFGSVDYLGIVPHLPTVDEGVELQAFNQQGGGPVAQALVTLARLGAKVGFVGRVGDDNAGITMKRDLEREGIDLTHLQLARGDTSPQCMILVHQPTGKRSICVYRGSAGEVKAEELNLAYLCSGRFLHLDNTSREASLVAARAARAAGVKVCLDAGGFSAGLEDLVKVTDILIASVRCAISVAPNGDYRTGADILLEMGPELVVVTIGEDGSYTKTADREFHTDSFSVRVVDTTGAGDVFHGAYLFSLLQNWDLETASIFASAAAAIKCTQLGGRAGIPTYTSVAEFLRQRDHHLPLNVV